MVRVGVVGAGYLGKFHIQKFLEIENCKLVAIVDINEAILEPYKKLDIKLTKDFKSILDTVDAVSIVVPTVYHYEIAEFFIKNGIHVFIEKPVTASLEECEKLIGITNENVVVQVGHIERFNPVYLKVKDKINKPRIMSFIRKGPFSSRGTDVDVVYDLTIHDIDLVLGLCGNGDILSLNVRGARVLTDYFDYILASFFINDTLVNIQTSRVSAERERKFSIIDENGIWECDLINFKTFYKSQNKEITISENQPYDALKEELKSFINSIINKTTPPVTLIDGLNALKYADMILQAAKR